MRVLATAKIEAAAPKGGETLLHQFLKLYRDAVQYIVDGIWLLDNIPSEEKLHKMFYNELRRLGLGLTMFQRFTSVPRRLLRVLRGIGVLSLF